LVAPYKRVFIGELADSDKWEIRLQIVRALPLFKWPTTARGRAVEILCRDIEHPQTFVKAWALDSLATFAEQQRQLMPFVRRTLARFARSGSKALAARARHIRARLSFNLKRTPHAAEKIVRQRHRAGAVIAMLLGTSRTP
jgi:hypothetical protein